MIVWEKGIGKYRNFELWSEMGEVRSCDILVVVQDSKLYRSRGGGRHCDPNRLTRSNIAGKIRRIFILG